MNDLKRAFQLPFVESKHDFKICRCAVIEWRRWIAYAHITPKCVVEHINFKYVTPYLQSPGNTISVLEDILLANNVEPVFCSNRSFCHFFQEKVGESLGGGLSLAPPFTQQSSPHIPSPPSPSHPTFTPPINIYNLYLLPKSIYIWLLQAHCGQLFYHYKL